jgi:hypothetical protein
VPKSPNTRALVPKSPKLDSVLKFIFEFSVVEPPSISTLMTHSVDMIENLGCPPPPTEHSINEDAISSLIVPAPGETICKKTLL